MKVLVLIKISYTILGKEETVLMFKDIESFLNYNGDDLPKYIKKGKNKLIEGLINIGVGEIEASNGDAAYLYYQEVI